MVLKNQIELVEIEESRGWARVIAPATPVPIVVRLHGPWFLVGPSIGVPLDTTFFKRVASEGLAIQAAAGVSCPSRYTLDQVRKKYGVTLDEARVIPNPVETMPAEQHWSGGDREKRCILFVGRLDRCKGADVLIRAFDQIGRQYPDVELVLVGPERNFLDDRGRPCRFEDYLREVLPDSRFRYRVKVLGSRSQVEIRELRRQAYVTVVCSRFENFPNVVLEAMAQGCPLVATSVGGIPEAIQNEHSGLLCKPDDADDLARKILALLSNPDLATRLGRQARADAETNYNPERIARRTLQFYEHVIECFSSQKHRRYLGVSST